ncbi:hypothetical protein [Actinocatenispora rupis]|uniref:Uncharacterized protein n=1 Tax=Actinocatenispora rupis TaxID=519421 RepID=A0A8J3J5Q5_9ACTN|nr:hypothetical protein [Actinocatenispora rupis]GID12437.1 hypothetical protein Aru02nite_33260 [Actinocatenispora rupis]
MGERDRRDVPESKDAEDTAVPKFDVAEEIPAGVGRAGAAALPDDGDDEEYEEPSPEE